MLIVFLRFLLWILKYFVPLPLKIEENMAYTKETLVISNPSEKLMKVVKELRRHKMQQLEKLRNMKSEDFSRRVILS